ncbi:MAG: CsbD family protein [Planctomycetaceae bacterium]|nr:MAG: CsbD family protein [Planctomycetaceae bacterium]
MAVNQQVMKGSWNQIKGKLRERWGQVTEDELEEARGNADQIVGLIQQRTGETRGEIEAYLERAASEAASVVERTKEAVVNTVCQTGENAQEMASRATESARAGYMQTERVIRSHPVESLAVCFGAGMITGVVIGLLMRAK